MSNQDIGGHRELHQVAHTPGRCDVAASNLVAAAMQFKAVQLTEMLVRLPIDAPLHHTPYQ